MICLGLGQLLRFCPTDFNELQSSDSESSDLVIGSDNNESLLVTATWLKQHCLLWCDGGEICPIKGWGWAQQYAHIVCAFLYCRWSCPTTGDPNLFFFLFFFLAFFFFYTLAAGPRKDLFTFYTLAVQGKFSDCRTRLNIKIMSLKLKAKKGRFPNWKSLALLCQCSWTPSQDHRLL